MMIDFDKLVYRVNIKKKNKKKNLKQKTSL